MRSIKKTWQATDKLFWSMGICFGIILPVLTIKLSFLSRVVWIGLILLLVNGGFSIWFGGYIYRKQMRWVSLFVFPLFFLLAAYFFMPRYAWYLAPAYWALSYLSWALRQQE